MNRWIVYREIAQPNIVRQIPRIIILYILRRSRSMKFSKYLFLKYWKISRKNIIFIIQIMYCRIITCLLSCEFIFLNKVLFRYTLHFSSNQLNKISPWQEEVNSRGVVILCQRSMIELFSLRVILVRIFPHSDWIGRDTSHLSVFSPNAGKYEYVPE